MGRRKRMWTRNGAEVGREGSALARLSKRQQLDACGACHARRTELTGDFTAGDLFLDHFDLAIVDETDGYYADGQVHGGLRICLVPWEQDGGERSQLLGLP